MTRQSSPAAKGLRAAALLAAGFLAARAVDGRPESPSEPVVFGPLAVKGLVPPMTGETYPHAIRFARPVWLKGFALSLLDERREPAAERGMFCHASFARVVPGGLPRVFLNFQDGYEEFRLPPGYGLPLAAGTYHLLSMLQSGSPDTDRAFHLRRVVDAVPQDEEPGLAPLRTLNVGVEGSALGLRPVQPERLYHDGVRCSHWWVPPGEREFSVSFTAPEDGSVKYLAFHLHAYAKEVRLSEEGGRAGAPLYRGRVELDERGEIRRMPFYSSAEGFPLAAGKRYRYSVVYDNTSGAPVSGMAGMIVFYHPRK
ncbi:MAG: hypothetical protein SF051_11235 [Elusimicrobiota bacterium]|nr:hypothetical protein [Elusimicrobiota bacterium]